MLQTIGEYARERLDARRRDASELALRHARRYAELAREIRDGIEGTDQVGSLERGIAEEGNLQAALDTLLATAKDGDAAACEAGMQMCGDLWLYWHIRGKNLTAREYAAPSSTRTPAALRRCGRAGALITAGLASWMLGQFERANDEWAEAYRIAADARSRSRALRQLRSLAASGCSGSTSKPGSGGRRRASSGAEPSASPGPKGFASTFDGILHAVAGDLDTAQTRYSRGARDPAATRRRGRSRPVARRPRRSWQPVAATWRRALDLYRQSLAAFEAIGDRAEEARILSEMAWTHLRHEDPAHARRYFLDSVQAYTDVASVRGVGLSLIGLAATEAVERRPETAVQIAAAAEVYAQQEGIVNVYSDETPGREFVDQARAALSADEVARATEAGRRLTIKEALDLARLPQTAAT